MSEQLVSKYLNNKPAGRKKRVYARLMDYFSLFVVSYLFFSIFYAVGAQTPVVKNISANYRASSMKMLDYIDESHIMTYNEKKNDLVDAETSALDYLLALTKTSAYVHNTQIPEYQDDGSYIMVDVNVEETFLYNLENYPLDNLSYYFRIFKHNEPSLNNYVINGVDYASDLDTYQYAKIMTLKSTYFVTAEDEDYVARGSTLSTYVVLTSECTDKMINKVIKKENIDDGTNAIYNNIFGGYKKAVDFGTKDIEKNSVPFNRLNNQFKKAYQSLTGASAIIYIMAYTFAFAVVHVVVGLISKEFVTLGQKVMGLGLCGLDEKELAPWKIILYYFLNYLLFSTSMIISFYFLGIFGILSLEIFPHFTLLAVVIFLLINNVFSFIMIFVTKNRHDLSTFAARVQIKDKHDFETPPGDDTVVLDNNSQEVKDGNQQPEN